MRETRSVFLEIIIILFVAVFARSLSLQWSPLPYNIDGLSEIRVAEDISGTGHFDFPVNASYTGSYVSDMPVLGLLLGYFASALGAEPIVSAQLLTAIVGSVAVLMLYLIFTRFWGSSSRASITSILILALIGSFVFSAGCVWKETLGFTLLLLALNSYPQRDHFPHRFVLTASLLLLPFTHHHATVVGFIIFTFAFIMDVAQKRKDFKTEQKEYYDLLTIVVMWGVAIDYYMYVELPYLDYLSPQTDLYLYLAVAFLMLVVCVKMSYRDRPLSRLPVAVVVPAAGVVLMVYNYFDPLFVGISAPATAIAIPFLAYLILVVPAWGGAQLALARMGQAKNLVLAMVFGPLSLILFAFLRGLDGTSYTVIYRTFDFIVPAFAIFIGLGFAALVRGRERLGMIAGASLVIICASTLPVAFGSQELFGVENQTYWYEYDAFKWFSEHDIKSVMSDQRLSETGNRLFDLEGSRGLPYDLREGLSLEQGRFYVLSEKWSKDGAQEFPFGVVIIESNVLDETVADSNIVYLGGPLGDQLLGFFAL